MAELTGYASIDKPWLKHYGFSEKDVVIPDMTLYTALVSNNADNLDTTCFICSGRNDAEITYLEFINMVDDAAKALKGMGLSKGSVVALTFKNSAEGIAMVFALSREGVVCHYIDPTNSPEEKSRMLREAEVKHWFLCEEFRGDAKKVIDNISVETIIVLPPMDQNHECMPMDDTCISWESFITKGNSVELDKPQPPTDEVMIVMYTGGSTGPSKGVAFAEYAFIAQVYLELLSGFQWSRNRINLCDLPGVIAYGLTSSILAPILVGEINVLVDCHQIAKFAENVLRYKPQDIACSPVHMQFLVNSPMIDDDTDLSFLKMFTCGGDGMTEHADVITKEFMAAHGAPNAFAQGCGFTETVGAFCYGQGDRSAPGAMGIPMISNNNGVFNPETCEELAYGEIGEWATQTESMMKGYYGSSAYLTEKALRTHPDGSVWLHLGDMVHMDEHGRIYMHDRASRTFNYMGMKIYPSALEMHLSSHEAIQKCVVSGVKIDDGDGVAISNQKVPIVNIALDPSYKGQEESIVEELEDLLKDKAQSYVDMKAYIFRETIPFTHRGKVNYQLLETEGLNPAESCIVITK